MNLEAMNKMPLKEKVKKGDSTKKRKKQTLWKKEQRLEGVLKRRQHSRRPSSKEATQVQLSTRSALLALLSGSTKGTTQKGIQ